MDDMKIKLSKPYVFEGETFTEIDLQGLEDLKAKDLVEIDRICLIRGNSPVMSGLMLDYALVVAHRATKKPIEFFEGLPAKDAMAIKGVVVVFFYDED